jgi:hypothetical protein
MNAELHVMSSEVLMPRICALLEDGYTVPLVISGGSMTPFLIHERDTVFLSPPDRIFKRGDMILYRRGNGQYVLHRVYAVEPQGYCLVGDAQSVLEHGIRHDQVIAWVSAVNRKGKIQKPGCFWWDFFEKVWIRMIPVRPRILDLYTRMFR